MRGIIFVVGILCFSNFLNGGVFREKNLEFAKKNGFEIIKYEEPLKNKNDVYIRVNKKILEDNLIDTNYQIEDRYVVGISKTNGENFLNYVNNDEKSTYKTWINSKAMGNKKEKDFKINLGIDKSFWNLGNELNLGTYISYDNKNLSEIKNNKIGLGLYGDYIMNDLGLLFLSNHQFNFDKIEYLNENKKTIFNENLNSFNGSLKLLKKIPFSDFSENNKTLYIEPSIKGSYIYNFSNETIDEKKINWKISESLFGNIGANLKLGYNFEKNDKLYNVYGSVELNKNIKNNPKFFLNKKMIDMPTDDFYNLRFLVGGDIVLNEIHNINLNSSINFKRINEPKYGIGVGYKYTWE